jgi:hypothetical protein
LKMESFRHNLTPVEVKQFLKSITDLTDYLLVRFVFKAPIACPQCGAPGLCKGAALSLYSSSIDKMTHEITICLHCGYRKVSTVLTVESL